MYTHSVKQERISKLLCDMLAGIRHLMFVVVMIMTLMESTGGQRIKCNDGE